MVWGVKRTHRKVAAAIALLGVAFYALLLPWHLTSQFTHQLYKVDIGEFAGGEFAVGEFAGAMCSSADSSPQMPATSCPICKGLAAFEAALAAPPQTALPVMPHAKPVLTVARDDAVRGAVPAYRNRGPPSRPA